MAAPRRDILFLTNSELGQCNVALAVAEEFLLRGEFRVHVASYRPLAKLVEGLSKRVEGAEPAQFHEIGGPSMTDLAIRSDVGLLCHRPGISGAAQGFQKVSMAMSTWSPSEYGRAYRDCVEILAKVQPAVVVVDPILHVGLDACHITTAPIVVLWPVPLKDVVVLNQRKLGVLWKYPVTGSGYAFPVPWRLVLANIFLAFKAAVAFSSAKSGPNMPQSEKDPEARSPFPLRHAYSEHSLHLTPAFREMDFPLEIQKNVISCGPIYRHCSPLSYSEPELDEWLRSPTVLISLGSHVKPTETVAVQMAKGIKMVFHESPGLQVLWKLQYDWESSKGFQTVLGALIAAGSVKVVSWIQSEVMAVLQTGHIVAYVHHGGANSYFEACKVGAPQVVLPQWLDTYDCATRVEWLGIGLHGSKKAAPGTDAAEFSTAVLKVLRDEDIRSKSAAMKALCQRTEGRLMAHDTIVEFCMRMRHSETY
ncbi:uncharacterized protein N7459_005492 [Penicillium hispanicum]|uniref:uncharacterized protein n=1 Tax=Penicillium hispanicum TaxID=1080232 RepID=UPI002540E204|nr:uncharacterized protein N7459_005492 [Penicillium hispanicum]KAJ5579507.1 hypothetical protein N7459_005492 [Penicillium hispanicum]